MWKSNFNALEQNNLVFNAASMQFVEIFKLFCCKTSNYSFVIQTPIVIVSWFYVQESVDLVVARDSCQLILVFWNNLIFNFNLFHCYNFNSTDSSVTHVYYIDHVVLSQSNESHETRSVIRFWLFRVFETK